jgi:5-formyltetrahydrofolate cyclo-ligase
MASSTTYWIAGLSTIGNISLGIDLVAGKKRVPIPAAGITALNTLDPIVITPYADHMEEKSQTRRVLRNLRKLAPEGDGRASSLLLEELEKLGSDHKKSIEVVASYDSYGSEPSTQTFNSTLLSRGIQILLPRLLDDNSLEWIDSESGENLGIAGISLAQVVVVPALSVDATGMRIGQGGGSYDRALKLNSGWKVCLLHDGEIFEGDLPQEAHDQKVNAVVTPTKIIRFS